MPGFPDSAPNGAYVLDGGLATELERRGADLRHPLWSARMLLERPDLLRAVHRDYLEAGADVVATATYQATFQGLAELGLDVARSEALLHASIGLVQAAWREVIDRSGGSVDRPPPVIAASIGPYGAYLRDGSEYRGDDGLSERELSRFHCDRLMVLANAGANLLAIETIPSRREAEALVDLLERHGQAKAWISFSGRDDVHIADGTPFAECVTSLEGSARVVATGINCTAPGTAAALLESARPVARKPFVVYPNTGERYEAGVGVWSGAAEIDWVDRYLDRYRAAGAVAIGGCCRTTPDTIRRIAQGLRGGLDG